MVDKLREDGYNVSAINASEVAIDEERFVNLRAEMWYAARESLNPANPAAMSLPKVLGIDLQEIYHQLKSCLQIVEEEYELSLKRKRKNDWDVLQTLEMRTLWLSIGFACSLCQTPR